MKRSGPLKRKTPMPRGNGFNRPSKESRNPNEPAWGEKPRAKLNRVSKRNSNKHVNEKFRREYMDTHPKCELCPLFDEPRADATDPHHVCRSILGTRRWDIETNLIAVCRLCHDWCHLEHPKEGLVLCLEAKRRLGELDWNELNRITRMNLCEHIGGYTGLLKWVDRYRLQLTQGE